MWVFVPAVYLAVREDNPKKNEIKESLLIRIQVTGVVVTAESQSREKLAEEQHEVLNIYMLPLKHFEKI